MLLRELLVFIVALLSINLANTCVILTNRIAKKFTFALEQYEGLIGPDSGNMSLLCSSCDVAGLSFINYQVGCSMYWYCLQSCITSNFTRWGR